MKDPVFAYSMVPTSRQQVSFSLRFKSFGSAEARSLVNRDEPDMKRTDLLAIPIDRRSSQTLQAQVYQTLRQLILESRWPSERPLPSSRELASQWNISRNTVLAAYDRLLGEGYLETQPRSGIFISTTLETSRQPQRQRAPSDSAAPTAKDQERRLRGPVPFHPSQPDVRLFPLEQWNRCRTRALRTIGTGCLDYQSRFTLGLPTLRHKIAQYLNHSRGVRCDWQQVAITSGSQHALFMLGQLLLKKGDKVLIEDPGYPGAQRAFSLKPEPNFCLCKSIKMVAYRPNAGCLPR